LLAEEWDVAEAHADALAKRTAAEPLPLSDLIVARGRILVRMGRGTASDEDAKELAALRVKAAAVDFRLDALRDALRAARPAPFRDIRAKASSDRLDPLTR
jgi:hypothetical protein